MRYRRTIYTFAMLCVLGTIGVPSQTRAGWLFGPDTAEECRSEYVGQAESDLAVRLIAKACNDLFAGAGREKWAECILDHVTDTRSDTAIKLIARSCANKAGDGASKQDKCLLAKLPGTNVDTAAAQIAHSCRD